MRFSLQKTIAWILKKLAQATVLRYKPAIIGVTGSVGKTSTRLAIAAALADEYIVRAPYANFNGEIGLPLTILGDWKSEDMRLLSRETAPGTNQFKKVLFLLKVIVVSAWRLILRVPYPEILVLEYGIDRPGDMRRLVRIARPNVAVMTAIGDAPAHAEFFKTPEDVAREKSRLIGALPVGGFAVLNADDAVVMDMKMKTRAQVMTFGFAPKADVSVDGFEYRLEKNIPNGVAFKICHEGAVVPVRLSGGLGRSQGYIAAAAATVGLIFRLNLVSISEGLGAHYVPAKHRMQIVPGIKSSTLIDDSYNASPLSMHAALETLKALPATRRIAVLGDMLEIGEKAMEEHAKIGQFVAGIADALFLIGPRARFIAEGALKKGFAKKNIFLFDSADEARIPLQDFVKTGDLIVLKASHAMDFEKLVQEIKGLEV